MTDEELDGLLANWVKEADKCEDLSQEAPNEWASGYAMGVSASYRAVVDTLTRLRKK